MGAALLLLLTLLLRLGEGQPLLPRGPGLRG
jgi:hypothetical protein